MPQGHAEDLHAPQDAHRKIVASPAACDPQGLQQFPVGQCREQIADVCERGTVVEFLPSEKRFSGVNQHWKSSLHRCVRWTDGRRCIYYATNPRPVRSLVEKSEKTLSWA